MVTARRAASAAQRDSMQCWLYLGHDALNRLIRKRQDGPDRHDPGGIACSTTGQLGLPSKSLAYSSQERNRGLHRGL